VCRDFAHLAVTLCRCMNIPARYCTGYLGDIGVPPEEFTDGFFRLVRRSTCPAAGSPSMPAILPRVSGEILMGRGRDAADVRCPPVSATLNSAGSRSIPTKSSSISRPHRGHRPPGWYGPRFVFAKLLGESPSRAGHRRGRTQLEIATEIGIGICGPIGLAGRTGAKRRIGPSRRSTRLHHLERRRLERHFLRVLTTHARASRPAADYREQAGGAGNIAGRACQDALPDGYTICIINADTMIYTSFSIRTLRSTGEADADRQLFHLIQVLVVNSSLERQERGRSGRRSRSQARHARFI